MNSWTCWLVGFALAVGSGLKSAAVDRIALTGQRELGTVGFDFAYNIRTATNGDLLVGCSADAAWPPGGPGNFGGEDFALWRLDTGLNSIWGRSFGGTGNDRLFDLTESSAGRLLLVGRSASPPSATKTARWMGGNDFWVVMTDQFGNALWDRTYGGDGDDRALAVHRLAGDRFILLGQSASLPNTVGGGKATPHYGGMDAYAVCIDLSGTVLWEFSFGGQGDDMFRAAVPLPDGNVVLLGSSTSEPSKSSIKTSPLVGGRDLIMVAITPAGRMLWQEAYGLPDQILDVDTGGAVAVADGFLVATTLGNPHGNPQDPATLWTNEGLLLRFNGAGRWVSSLRFANPLAQPDENAAISPGIVFQRLLSLRDGGYVISGLALGPKGSVQLEPTHGGTDAFVLQLDGSLNAVASVVLGGSLNEWSPAMAQLPNGEVAVAMESYSPADGTKSVPNRGSLDTWLVKIEPVVPLTVEILPAAELRFPTFPGRVYTLQYSLDLSTWMPWGSPFQAWYKQTTNFVSTQATGARFFRVVASP